MRSAYDHSVDLPPAEYLSHYTTRETAFGHILPQGQLRMSPYSLVNDPLENKPWQIPPTAFYSSSKPLWEWWTFGEGIREIWQTAKLLALTEDAPAGEGCQGAASRYGRCWARARMWDRYAEDHTGACLVFDAERLRANIVGSLAAKSFAHPYFGSVEYTAEGPFPRLHGLAVPTPPNRPSESGHAKVRRTASPRFLLSQGSRLEERVRVPFRRHRPWRRLSPRRLRGRAGRSCRRREVPRIGDLECPPCM